MKELVERMPKLSYNNKKALEETEECSCYFCLGVFLTKQALDNHSGEYGELTVECPKCGIDSLIPGRVEYSSLVEGLKRWFTGTVSDNSEDKMDERTHASRN